MLKDRDLGAGTQSAGDGACGGEQPGGQWTPPQGLAPTHPPALHPQPRGEVQASQAALAAWGAASPLGVTRGFPAFFNLVLLCFLDFSLTYTILSHELIKTSNIA